MCHFLFSEPIKEKMGASCMNMCTLKKAKHTLVHARAHTHTHTHKSISVLKTGTERYSLLQQMATMPQAKSESGRHTDNCCQIKEPQKARRPHLYPACILNEAQTQLTKVEESRNSTSMLIIIQKYHANNIVRISEF